MQVCIQSQELCNKNNQRVEGYFNRILVKMTLYLELQTKRQLKGILLYSGVTVFLLPLGRQKDTTVSQQHQGMSSE